MKRYITLLAIVLLSSCSQAPPATPAESPDMLPDTTQISPAPPAESHNMTDTLPDTTRISPVPPADSPDTAYSFPVITSQEATTTTAPAPERRVIFETWPGVPEDNWGINPFSQVYFPDDTGSTDDYDDIMELTGYFFRCDNGIDMFISDGGGITGPMELSGYDTSDLTDGSMISVTTYAVEESYPMGCTPLDITVIDSTGSDIPQSVLDVLSEIDTLGYHTAYTDHTS